MGHGQWPPFSPQVQSWTDNNDHAVTVSLYYDNAAPNTLVDGSPAAALIWTRDANNPWVWLLIDNHGGDRFAYPMTSESGSLTAAQLNADGFFVFDNIAQIVPGVSPE